MIICRTPFRISFFGGGTDYPTWYNDNGGSVLSTSINKFCYITLRKLPPFFDYNYRIRYYSREEVKQRKDIKHPSVREVLRFKNVTEGIEMVHHADLPAQSGLGTSSTFTVGMLHATYTLLSQMPTKYQLANEAINIEQNIIGENVGSQDQVAAAFGGLNRIDFGGSQEFIVTPLIIDPERLADFENHLVLFFTGFTRSANDIASEQVRLIYSKSSELKEMMELTNQAMNILSDKSICILEIGRLLNHQWKLKRQLSNSISNTNIDDIYNKGIKAGAIGGKLLGAGGGGFMLFFIEPEKIDNVKRELNTLLHVPFQFEFTGSHILYYDNTF
jgi:D-glycero-alpha-D-manno-heptose-7-phosphate kinase